MLQYGARRIYWAFYYLFTIVLVCILRFAVKPVIDKESIEAIKKMIFVGDDYLEFCTENYKYWPWHKVSLVKTLSYQKKYMELLETM